MSADAEWRKSIVELLRSSDVPLSAKQVAQTGFGWTSRKDIENVTEILNQLKTSGDAFEFPPARIGSAVRFGPVPPADWVGMKIAGMVKEEGGRLTITQVRAGLRKWETTYFDEAIGKLIEAGQLFYLTVQFKYLVSSPPAPFDHLLPRQVTALKEILERVNRHRGRALTLDDFRALVNGADATEGSRVEESGRPTEDLLRQWYQKDLPRRGGLSSIPIPWTWAHYESWCLVNRLRPDLVTFQDFMWSLYRAGKVEFIPHSMTQELSEAEAKLSLRSRHGEILYYWKWR